MDYTALNQLIDHFESEVEGIEPFCTRWKPLWEKIRTIGAGFKEARYPTRDENDMAWKRFQSLVERVKKVQDSERKTSESWKNKIETLANQATPPSDLEEFIYDMTFGLIEKGIKKGVDIRVLQLGIIDEFYSFMPYMFS